MTGMRRKRNERGASVLVVTLALSAMLLAAMGSMELGRYLFVRAQAQVAADTAVGLAVNLTETDRNGRVRLRYDAWFRGTLAYIYNTADLRRSDKRGALACTGQTVTWGTSCWPSGGADTVSGDFPVVDHATGGYGWGSMRVLEPATGLPSSTDFNFCSGAESSRYRIKFTVPETYNTIVLHWFGFKTFAMPIEATAAVRSETC